MPETRPGFQNQPGQFRAGVQTAYFLQHRLNATACPSGLKTPCRTVSRMIVPDCCGRCKCNVFRQGNIVILLKVHSTDNDRYNRFEYSIVEGRIHSDIYLNGHPVRDWGVGRPRPVIVQPLPTDAELLGARLRASDLDVDLTRVGDRETFIDALSRPWAAVIADFRLPGFDALEALDLVSERGVDVPVIVVTGAFRLTDGQPVRVLESQEPTLLGRI